MKAAVIQLARRALPLMNATHRAEAERIIAHFERTPEADGDAFGEYLRRAAAAWKSDMQPARTALASALHAESTEALAGLRHLLPGLLREANESPALAGVLAEAMVHGFYGAFQDETSGRTANAAVALSEDPVVTAALRQWRSRSILPADVGSAELRGMEREIALRSVFSARTTNADYLTKIAEVVDDILSAKINLPEGRIRLMRKLKQLGYSPEQGFPGDMELIPPAERGSLQDLSSERRIDLVLETNVRIAQGYAQTLAGSAPYARTAYPAWELVRLYLRDVPRGSAESHSIGWQRRWSDAGESVAWDGALQDEMIARKDSPIWPALGAGAGGYTDTLGNGFPPFAFRSGYAWKAVSRERAVGLKLIQRGNSQVQPVAATLTPGQKEVSRIVEAMPTDLRAELERELAA